jgi:hypothetical protein
VLELHILARVVLADRVHHAEDAGVNQIFEQNLLRQPDVNSPCHEMDLRQMLENEALALGFVEHLGQRNGRGAAGELLSRSAHAAFPACVLRACS